MNLDKKTLEGIMNVGTSPTNSEEEEVVEEKDESNEEGVELNNSTVPTVEEEENANIVNDVENGDTEITETETEENLEPESEAGQEELSDGLLEADQNAQIDPELGISEASASKMFTQSQVDEIAGRIRKETREKVTKDIYSRYGVNTPEELDELFTDAQRFATSRDDFAEKERAWNEAEKARNEELTSVKERVALLESGIDRNRFEDARLILRGKGLEVTAENIAAELATHPEWKKEEVIPGPVEQAGLPFRKNPNVAPNPAPENAGPATQIAIPTLGNNSADNPQPELSERERAFKMFKV